MKEAFRTTVKTGVWQNFAVSGVALRLTADGTTCQDAFDDVAMTWHFYPFLSFTTFLQFWDETGLLVAFSDRTILGNPNRPTQAIFSEVAGLGGLE